MRSMFCGLLFVVVVVTTTASSIAQGEAAGGRLPSPTTKPKPTTEPKTATQPEATATKATANRGRQSAALDRIDGKWLTTGNDFGTSQVVFTQNGNHVTGNITFVDGHTATLTGTFTAKKLRFTLTNPNGQTGSGWLELSWPHFLGGPWKSARQEGSWTMSRIEGQWCLNGDRNRVRRVTHDAGGRLAIVTEDGSEQTGYLNGYLYLNSANGPIQGNTFYDKRYRIEWANGTTWTWCGR